MSDKKQPEKSPKPAKPKKILTEEEKAEKSRAKAEAEARQIAEATLSRYMSWVENLKGRHAFRGQADAAWKLRSSAYRRLLEKRLEQPDLVGHLFTGYLHERVNEATMRFSAHGDLQPLEVMARMQHHGAATGLIDFTESALAALWFACESKLQQDGTQQDGKVFAVRLDDPERIREIKTRDGIKGELDEFFPIAQPEKLWAWRPGDGDSRMITQQSLFVFGRAEIEKEFVSDEFHIPAAEKNGVFPLLEKLGTSENFLFSDFAGFAAANAPGKDYPLQRAETYYTEKIEKDPKNPAHHFSKGVFNLGLGSNEKARVDFTRAIELEPQDVAAYSNRGIALDRLGRREEAFDDFTRAIELDPQNAAVLYFNRGVTLNGLGRCEEAFDDFTRAIELDPQYAAAYFNRGFSLHHSGRHQAAVADWKEAKRLGEQTGHKEVVRNAAECLAKMAGC